METHHGWLVGFTKGHTLILSVIILYHKIDRLIGTNSCQIKWEWDTE